MFLVDTSVWVDHIRARDTESTEFLADLLRHPSTCGISDQIYMEVLQGARDMTAFDTLERYFGSQRFYSFENSRRSHAEAARVYAQCRQSGITIRSSIDCLVAQCDRENELTLLHHDRGYLAMAGVMPELRQKHFLS